MSIIKMISTTVATVLVMACTAFAAVDSVYLNAYHSSDWDDWRNTHLGTPIDALPTDTALWNLTGVHETAGHTNELWLTGNTYNSFVLSNNAIGTTASHVDLGAVFFADVTQKKVYSLFGENQNKLGGVNVYEVQQGFTSYFGSQEFDFLKGDLFIALDDYHSHVDYDDFIIQARAATPIPGAAWLLGSGLLGLVGLKRRMRS